MRLLIFLLFVPALVCADESSTISTPIAPAPVKRRVIPLNFFADALPVPLLQGGAGVAVELNALNRWSLWLGLERERSTSMGPFNFVNEEEISVYDNRFAGIRHYFTGIERSGWFAGGGVKYTEISMEYYPGFLRGARAHREERFWGPYAGAGYRFLLNSSRTFTWLLDVGANIEHGFVKRMRYVEEQPGMFGPERARIEPEFRYFYSPEVRLGAHF